MNKENVNTLAEQWLALHTKENQAYEAKVAIEQQLITLLGVKPEGSKTHRVDHLAIKITGRMTYTCNDIVKLAAEMPELVKPVLDESALKKLRTEQTAIYMGIAPMLTVKPGKTGVSITHVEEAAPAVAIVPAAA